jgi:hypothetical protein
MAGEGYGLEPAALQETAQGINAAITELKAIGVDEAGESGRGFSELSLSGLEIGHDGLQGAFDAFCERWAWGVRTLVQDGNEMANRLGLAAGRYHDMEQYAVGLLKDVVSDVGGDPHKSDDQVEQESWQQLAADSRPDYSAASWDKAGSQMAAQWKAEGRDLAEGPMGLGKTAANAVGAGDAYARVEDQAFGPVPKQDAR